MNFSLSGVPNSFIGTVSNHSDEPWAWDCTTGDLSRWNGSGWEPVGGSSRWIAGDGVLALYEAEGVSDCGPPSAVVAPGASEEWPMYAEWIDHEHGGMFGNRPLGEPGVYRLVSRDGTGRGAVGRFTITATQSPPTPLSQPAEVDGHGI